MNIIYIIFNFLNIHWRNNALLIFSFLLFLPCLSFSQNKQFRIKKFSLEEGLSQVSVNDLLMDPYGFVWIATADGLNRFDGKDFKHYKYNAADSLTISGNFINKLLADKRENIWIGTNGNGLNYFDSKQDVFRRVALQESKDQNESITALGIDENENIWVGSRSSGLHRLHPVQNDAYLQSHYYPNKSVTALLIDQQKEMWVGDVEGNVYRTNPLEEESFLNEPEFKVAGEVQAFYLTEKYLLTGCEGGLYLYDLQSRQGQFFDFGKIAIQSAKYVTSFLEANPSQVWIGTGSGLFLFDWTQKAIVNKILYANDNNTGLSNNTVQSLLRINNGQLLAGTANSLNVIDFTEPGFKNISKDRRGQHLLNDNVIFSIFKEEKDLWIGTSDGGVNLIRGDTVFYFNADQHDPASISGTVVRAIVKDAQNQRLWLATTRGLSMIDLKTFDPYHPKFIVFNHKPEDPNSINMDFLMDLALDQQNNLWGATFGQGVFRLEIGKSNEVKVVRYQKEEDNPNSLPNDIVHCIRIDRLNNVWVGTQGGLLKLSFTDARYNSPSFALYSSVAGKQKSLSNNTVYDVLIDAKDRLWVGTRHGLNLHLGNNEFGSWTEQKQFPNAIIYSIQDDEQGNLWLGTNDGIVRFDPETYSFKQYGIEDNIQSIEFDKHAKFKDAAGTIYLGGIGGITYFNPKNLEHIDYPQPLYFSELRINNQEVSPKNEILAGLNQSIFKTKELNFNHNQFPFYLKFSSIDFRSHKNVRFAYKLLPSDKDWNPLKDQEIQFLNLPAGNYTLLVNGFSRGKEWEQAPLKMALSIAPPWWATWWAYVIYFGMVLALATRFYRFQLSKKLAVSESKRLQEVNQLKNSLYTNITHEFRTPLTIIQGMTDSLKYDIEHKALEAAGKDLELIRRNSDGLLRLVNEMLDLSKLESGNMELHLEQANVIPFVKYLSESFHSLAQDAKINLMVYAEIDELMMDFDADKLAAIVSNVLSNAIKFTPENGKVVVHLGSISEPGKKHFLIKVKDNGRGIATEDIPHIFNRFYQVNTSHSREHEGTGIGLALTKELMDLLGGSIVVESELEKGSTFIIKIPVRNVAPFAKKVGIVNQKLNVSPSVSAPPQYLKVNADLPLLLVIEDNEDVAYYLKTCLHGKYETLHAKNGVLGIEMAYKNIPDIIICDIMMPGKDGFEVCLSLKSDERTDHIPIIMLTAKATLLDRLAGLSQGADAYLTKPFVKEELITRLDQLILLRKRMIHKFQNNGFSQLLKNRAENPEAKFLQKVISIIHKEISDDAFGAAKLARELNLSESQVYRKLKAITGRSTALFIRSIRLQKGKELLLTTDRTISEISYDVGFNDPSWFSRTFKQEFGISPGEIAK